MRFKVLVLALLIIISTQHWMCVIFAQQPAHHAQVLPLLDALPAPPGLMTYLGFAGLPVLPDTLLVAVPVWQALALSS